MNFFFRNFAILNIFFENLFLKGLDTPQVDKNQDKYGSNQLTPPKAEPMWLKFMKTLFGGFQLLLWAGSVLSFAAYIAQCFQSADPPSDNVRITKNFFDENLGIF